MSHLENGERYDVRLKGGQIGNRPWAFDWHHYRLPWMTLNRSSSGSLQLQSNISITVYGIQQHWADTRSIERISCYLSGCLDFIFFVSKIHKVRTPQQNAWFITTIPGNKPSKLISSKYHIVGID